MDSPIHKISLFGQNKHALTKALQVIGVSDKQLNMRVNQLWRWLYVYGIDNFSEMTSLSKELRHSLETYYTLTPPQISQKQRSEDGTCKYLFKLSDGQEVETVYIPEPNRGTLCISSQVGCTLACRFCYTGTQKLVRNLESHEIIGQIIRVKHDLKDWIANEAIRHRDTRQISNIVMMGMGEPLYNVDNVISALNMMRDENGLAFSRRRITLSTAGVVPEIPRIGKETGVMLAISLHAVRDDIRNQLVPLNKKYPIAQLLEACRHYPELSNARRITFEYVMLKDINDSPADAKELIRLLRGIPSKINLIPFNPWPNSPYECSQWERIESFAEIINRAGYPSPIRRPRGRDIMAACGQLKSDSVKPRASELKKQANG